MDEGKRAELIEQLFEIGAVKFGEFVLKTGIKSPVYFDFRILVSHPQLMVNQLRLKSECLPC